MGQHRLTTYTIEQPYQIVGKCPSASFNCRHLCAGINLCYHCLSRSVARHCRPLVLCPAPLSCLVSAACACACGDRASASADRWRRARRRRPGHGLGERLPAGAAGRRRAHARLTDQTHISPTIINTKHTYSPTIINTKHTYPQQ